MDPTQADARERIPERTTDPLVSIVIPAKNEARNLEEVLPQLPCVHEVILVDGHSTDGTVETARELLPDVRVLAQTRRGKGNALAVGFEAATGDVIVMFDADGSADPRELPSFVGALVAGADFAKGSRNLDDGGSEDITGIRHMGNLALVRTANVLFGTRFTDLCYGYNAFWRDVLAAFDLPATKHGTGSTRPDRMLWGDGFEVETLLNCRAATAKLKIVEVPSVELPRIHGESNLNARVDGTRVLRTLMTEWKRHRVAAAKAVLDLTDVTTSTRDSLAEAPAAPALGRPEMVEHEHDPMSASLPLPRVGDQSHNVHSLHEDDRTVRSRFDLLGAVSLDQDIPVSESA
jgi:glycosyltransferase involved in cell wall biosynthesis